MNFHWHYGVVGESFTTTFEDISVEPDGNMANYRQVIGEKVRLKDEVHSWFLRSFSRGERGALVAI